MEHLVIETRNKTFSKTDRLLLLQGELGRYKSRTGSTRTASPGRINSDRLGPTMIYATTSS